MSISTRAYARPRGVAVDDQLLIRPRTNASQNPCLERKYEQSEQCRPAASAEARRPGLSTLLQSKYTAPSKRSLRDKNAVGYTRSCLPRSPSDTARGVPHGGVRQWAAISFFSLRFCVRALVGYTIASSAVTGASAPDVNEIISSTLSSASTGTAGVSAVGTARGAADNRMVAAAASSSSEGVARLLLSLRAASKSTPAASSAGGAGATAAGCGMAGAAAVVWTMLSVMLPSADAAAAPISGGALVDVTTMAPAAAGASAASAPVGAGAASASASAGPFIWARSCSSSLASSAHLASARESGSGLIAAAPRQ
mmetsp:Transcript_52003/g.119635  ORF Transcript_52003/g.119635 Transcript_52003/m.119635 type:complete len:312 (-) Transcript_52003:2107-3042(-)